MLNLFQHLIIPVGYETLKQVIAYGKFIFTTFRGYRVTAMGLCKGLLIIYIHNMFTTNLYQV